MQLLALRSKKRWLKIGRRFAHLSAEPIKKSFMLLSLTLLELGNMDILSYQTIFRYENATRMSLLFILLLYGWGAIY